MAAAAQPPLRHGDLVAQAYAARGQAAAWVAGPVLTPQARLLLEAVAAARADGLDPAAYHLAELDGLLARVAADGQPVWADADAALRAEVLLADAFLALGADLARGRIDPGTLWDHWARPADLPDPVPRLQALLADLPPAAADQRTAAADSVAAALAACRPGHREYAELRRAVLRLEAVAAAGGWPVVGPGPLLRPGAADPRVPRLRARLLAEDGLADPQLALGVPWHLAGGGDRLDPALVGALRRFQASHGLAADGVVGPRTLAALDVPADRRAAQGVVNLERWRWLPRDLGPRHIRVNIPDYSLTLVGADTEPLRMRAIVGRPDRPTPVLSARMQWLVLNPRWSVPQKLAREDLLPKVAADPGYLAERGFRVFRDWRPDAAEIDPAAVDWPAVVAQDMAFKFRQEPGPRNPLGRMKFLFPNEFSVYIHDTDQRWAFTADDRRLSSGCVRIEQPEALLRALATRGGAAADSSALAAMEAGETVSLGLSAPLPVHLVYFTVWVDERGVVQFRDDCYGYDETLMLALAAPPAEPSRARQAEETTVVARSAPRPPSAAAPAHQVRTGPVSTWTNPEPE